MERDVALWAWLSLFYSEQVYPLEKDGGRKSGGACPYIPAVENDRKYYRHLVAGPFSIYRAHRDEPGRVVAVLASPVDKPGDIAEQLASRQELPLTSLLWRWRQTCYVDSSIQKAKKGAAGRGPGSVRRFADVLNQFDLTWDLYAKKASTFRPDAPDFNCFM